MLVYCQRKKSYKKDIKQESNFKYIVGNVDQNTYLYLKRQSLTISPNTCL